MRRTRRLSIALLACALPLASAPEASAATAATAASAARSQLPVCAGASRPNPIAVGLSGVRGAYAAGGGWSTLRLTLRNRSGASCGGLRPVLVYGARNHTLRPGAVRLESRQAGHWRGVDLDPALGELAGQVGSGLGLSPHGAVTLTLRMRIARAAPHGQWLSLAVAYAPLPNHPTTEPWPVGVTNPAYFRVR